MKQNDQQLSIRANDLRQAVISMLATAGSGHTAGPLGLAELFAVLYFDALRLKPKDPTWEGRDRLILSAGHLVPLQYVAMAQAGFFPTAELKTLRRLNSRLQGHPSRVDLPGIEAAAGPLGQGLSVAVGMALAGQLDQADWRVYCVSSDGEFNEGQAWEALMAAAAAKAFQASKGLTADGFVGNATKTALNNCGSTTGSTTSSVSGFSV
jgi:transketolase